MKVFISWSGAQSEHIAKGLKQFLADLFQDLEVFLSSVDIDSGERWNTVIGAELDSTDFGVLCLTPDNVDRPWILFEAGALAKSVKKGQVVPFLYQLSRDQLRYPLAQFQGEEATRAGTLKIAESMNKLRIRKHEQSELERLFDVWWGRLDEIIHTTPSEGNVSAPTRSSEDMLAEILELTRGISSHTLRLADEQSARERLAAINAARQEMTATVQHKRDRSFSRYLESLADNRSLRTADDALLGTARHLPPELQDMLAQTFAASKKQRETETSSTPETPSDEEENRM